jgi:hypothetical protein
MAGRASLKEHLRRALHREPLGGRRRPAEGGVEARAGGERAEQQEAAGPGRGGRAGEGVTGGRLLRPEERRALAMHVRLVLGAKGPPPSSRSKPWSQGLPNRALCGAAMPRQQPRSLSDLTHKTPSFRALRGLILSYILLVPVLNLVLNLLKFSSVAVIIIL